VQNTDLKHITSAQVNQHISSIYILLYSTQTLQTNSANNNMVYANTAYFRQNE